MVYQAVKQAREYIEAGNGPMIVESKDVPGRRPLLRRRRAYRPPDEFNGYRDPLDVLKRYVDDSATGAIEATARAELADAAEKALAGPFPDRDVIFKNLYAE